jgi:3-methylfumaryl-CoA hydratase
MSNRIQDWVGRRQERKAFIDADIARRMQATLNREPTLADAEALPLAWHWLYFHEVVSGQNLGVDGHPRLGGFMPPVSFGGDQPPRRMWAGGSFNFTRPLLIGQDAVKRSTVTAVTPKQGRSGALVFVNVEHEIFAQGESCFVEQQTIVYREPIQQGGAGPSPRAAPTHAEISLEHRPDPIQLFWYSALTFNAHRIHYDVDYCREHEGYPGLVVHGPLIATLLLDLFVKQYGADAIASYKYRSLSPLFCPDPFTLNGGADGQGWVSNHQGDLSMQAAVSLTEPRLQ